MKIDAHQHYWKYDPGDYNWITDGMNVLRRDFLPSDLEPELESAGMDGAVAVQAMQHVKETEWLLALADEHAFIKGVVGWFPLTDHYVEAVLQIYADHPFLKGVRHVIQDEPDDHFVLREDFNRGVGLLESFGLTYDVLIYERHLPTVPAFVDQHPYQVFVLDHVGKPRIEAGVMEPWRTFVRRVAEREHCYCKLSGMVTEANWKHWTPGDLRPYMDTVLEAFGPDRLMFGSDWPVCLLACTYSEWHDLFCDYIATLSEDEQARIMGGTATEVYHLKTDVPVVRGEPVLS